VTPNRQLRALRACRDGGEIVRHELNWLRKWGMIDRDKKLTVKGTEALADYEEENIGD
jgi:hypothetical protein